MPIMRVHAPRLIIANLGLNGNPGGSLFLNGDVCTRATVSLGRTHLHNLHEFALLFSRLEVKFLAYHLLSKKAVICVCWLCLC